MKILLVCESTHKRDSGGRVARYLTKILKNADHQVKLVALKDDTDEDSFYHENDVYFIPLKKQFLFRLANIFWKTRESGQFKSILQEFAPDVIHFASFDDGKPPQFLTEAYNSNATVVLQPWTMQFYCIQGFGFREGEKCNLCASGNYFNALKNNCTSYKGIPGLIKRKKLHKRALKADVFLSSNSELDQILLEYGVAKEKIVRFTVPFDYTAVIVPQISEGDYSIFYGQSNAHKGLNVLIQSFTNLPEKKLRLFPMASLPDNVAGSKNIEVVHGATWKQGLPEAIAAAKIVLVPSLWSSSTEYSMCEALLFKKPVVVFDVGVHKHIFENKINAMVVEPNDIDAYTAAIKELDENDELRKKISENGYKTLLQVNDPVTLQKTLLKAYTLQRN